MVACHEFKFYEQIKEFDLYNYMTVRFSVSLDSSKNLDMFPLLYSDKTHVSINGKVKYNKDRIKLGQLCHAHFSNKPFNKLRLSCVKLRASFDLPGCDLIFVCLTRID